MIQIYADGVLAYDSRLRSPGADYTLLGLTTTTVENKGGTATIIMPPGHPAYDTFVGHRTILEFYRDGELKFRGRALYPSDDFLGRRTWTIEGELCMLQDSTARPYLYQASPEDIFRAVLSEYNSQVDEYKQFRVGTVTVKDSNDYIRLESETAEQSLDVINKLLERCGGYIVFSTATDGIREINWYANPGFRSSQVIEFGKNLTDVNRISTENELATAIIPYGAADPETGIRVDITSVNDGLDYIVDEESRLMRGWISKAVYWDDVTEPVNLKRKAEEWIKLHRQIVTSLTISAIDLSLQNKNIDDFQVGDTIRVLSKPHNLNEDFRLTSYTENWLQPEQSTITLGKDTASLTSADVAGDNESRNELRKITQQIKADYQTNITNAIEAAQTLLTSLIQQTSEEIKLEVAESYATEEELTSAISTSMTQLSDSFTFEFNQLTQIVNENDESAREQFEELKSYIRMKDGTLEFGRDGSRVTLRLTNDQIAFLRDGVVYGWWDGEDFHTGNIVVEVNERAQFGNFAFVPRSNGSLSFLKIQ